MNMEAQSALDALGRLFSRRDSEGRWAAALRGAVSALMAFVLALVRAGGGAPFAIALTAAAGTDWTGIGALLGAALGYLVGGGLGWGIRYLAACVLLFTVRTVFQAFEFGRRPLFMPFAALCVTALTAFLANFSLSLGTAPDSAKLLLESSLASACTFFYRCALFPDKDLSESGEIRRSISRTVLGASLLMALVPLRLFDVLCVGRVLALIVLTASALNGSLGIHGRPHAAQERFTLGEAFILSARRAVHLCPAPFSCLIRQNPGRSLFRGFELCKPYSNYVNFLIAVEHGHVLFQ